MTYGKYLSERNVQTGTLKSHRDPILLTHCLKGENTKNALSTLMAMEPGVASGSGSAKSAVEQPTHKGFQASASRSGFRGPRLDNRALHGIDEYSYVPLQRANRGSNNVLEANLPKRCFHDFKPNGPNSRRGYSRSFRGRVSGKQRLGGRDFASAGEVLDDTITSQGGSKTGEHGREDHETAKTLSDKFSNLCLRESLIEKLRCGQYSCPICLCSILPRDEIWSCDGCYHMYHLKCMTDWALSAKLSKQDPSETPSTPKNKWRCPSCQKEHSSTNKPLVYRCFCNRKTKPEYHPGQTTIPHGCDEICGKQRKPREAEDGVQACTHTCTELCHPGPCPPCVSTVNLLCPCGRVVRRARCGERPPSPCGAPCTHTYNSPLGSGQNKCAFGGHPCPDVCHIGDCPPCPQLIKAVCYCGRVDELTICGGKMAKRYHLEGVDPLEDEIDACDLACLSEADAAVARRYNVLSRALFVGTVFSCEQKCGRLLNCRQHKCQALCHPGDCEPCQLLPASCLTCPCGRVPLSKLVMSCDPHGDRTRCTDPVPVCPNVCERPNPICGHPCPAKCHAGDCPPCKLTTTITCRCGRSTKEVTCSEFADQKASSGVLKMTCERICRKKKTCGRHKCKNQCCDMVIHACMEICGRTLSCGKHTCEDPCHCGPCGSCWRGVIYEEVHCYCGYTVLPPPQPCGTKPPECDQPCTREHPCGHPVRHTCHSGPECPPCTELLTKPCPGGHTFLYNVPCFQIVATCGRVCDKPLPGCAHKCQRTCHAGDCLVPTTGGPRDAVDHCTQPCLRPRPECGHACAVPCHDAQGLTCVQAIAKSAPKCRALIDLVCLCGRRQESQPCYQVRNLARQLEKKDPTIFLRAQNTTVGESGLPFGLTSNAILPCDSSCAKQAKAEKATTADTGDGSARPWVRGGAHVQDDSLPPPFPAPEYSDWLKQFASNNIVFVTDVEQKLVDLVEQALGPEKPGEAAGVKCPSHRFPPMNKQKRRFIKELAEFYGVETVAFDPEPHRHLLAMTTRATACFPGGSRQHYTSLSSQMHKQFTGSVKVTGVGSSLSNRLAPVRSNVEAVSVPRNQVPKPLSFSVATASSSSANASQDT